MGLEISLMYFDSSVKKPAPQRFLESSCVLRQAMPYAWIMQMSFLIISKFFSGKNRHKENCTTINQFWKIFEVLKETESLSLKSHSAWDCSSQWSESQIHRRIWHNAGEMLFQELAETCQEEAKWSQGNSRAAWNFTRLSPGDDNFLDRITCMWIFCYFKIYFLKVYFFNIFLLVGDGLATLCLWSTP